MVLAIWNYIARTIVYDHPDSIDRDYVDKHTVFATGHADIGYGMRGDVDHGMYRDAEKDTALKEARKTLTGDEITALAHLDTETDMEMTHQGTAGAHWTISFDDFKKALAPYDLDYVARVSQGDPDEDPAEHKRKLKLLT